MLTVPAGHHDLNRKNATKLSPLSFLHRGRFIDPYGNYARLSYEYLKDVCNFRIIIMRESS